MASARRFTRKLQTVRFLTCRRRSPSNPIRGGLAEVFEVFVITGSNDLWSRQLSWGRWGWQNHGHPDGVNIQIADPAAVVYVDAEGPRPYVFALGDDSQLWCRYWSGNDKLWVSLDRSGLAGNPSAADPLKTLRFNITATLFQGRPYVFAPRAGNLLWTWYWTGEIWENVSLGSPHDEGLHSGMRTLVNSVSAVASRTTADDMTFVDQLVVFVAGGTHGEPYLVGESLWMCRWDGESWAWAGLGNYNDGTSGTPVSHPSGLAISSVRPSCFVEGAGGSWQWFSHSFYPEFGEWALDFPRDLSEPSALSFVEEGTQKIHVSGLSGPRRQNHHTYEYNGSEWLQQIFDSLDL